MCLYYLFQNGKTHMVSDNTWIGAIVTKVYDGVRSLARLQVMKLKLDGSRFEFFTILFL